MTRKLTEAHKQKLRDNIARAREAKKINDDYRSGKVNMEDLVGLIQSVNTNISDLKERVIQVEKKQNPPTATDQIAKVMEKEEDEAGYQEMKIHPKHRLLVDNILGKQFIAWESYDGSDSTHFEFHIKVPMELSSVPTEDRAKGRTEDIRTRVISQAAGENGVKDWCEMVRKNLNKYYTTNALPSPFSINA